MVGITVTLSVLVVVCVVGFIIWCKRKQGSIPPGTSNSTSRPRTTNLQQGNSYGGDNPVFNTNNQSAHFQTPSAPPVHPPPYEDIDYVSPVHHPYTDHSGYAYAY